MDDISRLHIAKAAFLLAFIRGNNKGALAWQRRVNFYAGLVSPPIRSSVMEFIYSVMRNVARVLIEESDSQEQRDYIERYYSRYIPEFSDIRKARRAC